MVVEVQRSAFNEIKKVIFVDDEFATGGASVVTCIKNKQITVCLLLLLSMQQLI